MAPQTDDEVLSIVKRISRKVERLVTSMSGATIGMLDTVRILLWIRSVLIQALTECTVAAAGKAMPRNAGRHTGTVVIRRPGVPSSAFVLL